MKVPPDSIRTDKIRKILRTRYPHVKTQLRHRTPFELLVATILSAQCTDRQVNQATPALFAAYPTPEKLARGQIRRIEALIRSTGFFHNKAKNIKHCAQALLEKHGGKVPQTLEELTALPGVGRKTANVVLGMAFGVPGMVVDTHVKRISRRFHFTDSQDPVKIEFDLMALFPEKEWNDLGLRMIYLGRELCTARKPKCDGCPMNDFCPSAQQQP